MALFGNKRREEFKEEQEQTFVVQEEKRIETPDFNTSTLQYGVKLKGDIEAEGSLVIGGDFIGNATVEDTIVIEVNANFIGNIKAKNVKIAGKFEGKVEASSVEITKNASFKGLITATKTFLAGNVQAIIKSSDSLEILPSSVIYTKEAKSANIKILGEVKGRVIASELLEVTSGGSIEGTIVTKGIKTEQGGTIIGNIQTFDEAVHGVDIEYTLEDVFDDGNSLELKGFNTIDTLSSQDLQKYAKKEDKKEESSKEINEESKEE